jgi:hypothetical protein
LRVVDLSPMVDTSLSKSCQCLAITTQCLHSYQTVATPYTWLVRTMESCQHTLFGVFTVAIYLLS